MVNPFDFPGVGLISFGLDRVEKIADDLAELEEKGTAVVLISDAGVARAGILDRVKTILQHSGRDVAVFADLESEPRAESVDRAAAVVRRCENPCVIGLGGGSALDVAKLAAVVVGGDRPVEDYALCAHPLPKRVLKTIMIPTTAGTGSEVTRNAIFKNREGRKMWAWGQQLLPDRVILDPRLTVSMPAHVTAASGLDALVHAIEACTSQQRNPLSDALALHAIRLGKDHLVTAIEKPGDLTARGGMLLASTLAGLAFGATGTAAAHSIGHALATIAGISHGRAVAIALDAILEWNAEASPEAFSAVAEALGAHKRAEDAAPAFRALIQQTGIDRSLAGEEIDPETLATLMLAEENRPMLDNNARKITATDALELARRTVNL